MRCIFIFLLRFHFGKAAEPNTCFVEQNQRDSKQGLRNYVRRRDDCGHNKRTDNHIRTRILKLFSRNNAHFGKQHHNDGNFKRRTECHKHAQNKGQVFVDIGRHIDTDRGYTGQEFENNGKYQKIGKRNFTVSELREILNCENEYLKFAEFERRIIVPAVKEINDHSDIYVEYKKLKTGRIITEIEFIIKSKRAVENTKEIITACDEFEKLTQTELEKLKNDYPMSEIVEAYDYVRKSTHSYKIKNWYAYLLTVLKSNHSPKQLTIDGGKLLPLEEKEILPEEEKNKPDFETMKKNLLNQFKM